MDGGLVAVTTIKRLAFNMGVRDPEVRFLRSVEPGPAPDYAPDLGPCLLFVGADNGNGYGQFQFNGSNSYAHRYAWERTHGPIPEGLTVDHLCRMRRCCNVAHLELVSSLENAARGVAARTACYNGHPYPPDQKPGRRRCKVCQQRQQDLQSERLRALTAARGDSRIKYDPDLRDSLVWAVIAGDLSVAAAAQQLGCSTKYMDKRVRNTRRAA
jgi:hypothetical protein